MIYALAAIIGYLLGSVPFGLVLCKIFGYGDIREIGSGNIGATNVLRTGNKPLALATLILDIGKGAAAVLLIQYMLTYDASVYAGIGAIFGHVFPVWLKFKGGKGVATTLGTITALHPLLGVSCCGLWIATALVFRISSLSALVAIGLSPVLAWFFTKGYSMMQQSLDGSTTFYVNQHMGFLPYACGIFAVLVFYRHKENIQRLLKGEEPKIGDKKKEAEKK